MNNPLKPNAGTVINIIRYPIKGFAGEELVGVELTKDKGLPHDRRWAIRNGSVSDKQQKEWEPCSRFIRMTQHEELPKYCVDNDNGQYYLIHPNGSQLKIAENENYQQLLFEWFKHTGMSLSHSHDKTAYWDHSDAHLSIINLSTLKAMSMAAGVDLDPQRFRGNLLIDTGIAWSEFSLIGNCFVIGESEIEILRPIDRCKATSVNPKTGHADINIPHFLSSQYGHFFCGVYARVIKSGCIQRNDTLSFQSAAPNAPGDAIKVDTAPAPEHWPRAMQVIKKVEESHNVISFYLKDPLGDIINDIAPASYLRLHIQNSYGPLYRSYTISREYKKDHCLRISIKKEKGRAKFSPWAHRYLNEGDNILVSGPFVDPSLQWPSHGDRQKQVIIFTAGIGITMATSVLSALQNANYPGMIRMAHSIQYKKDAALWHEVTRGVEQLKDAKAWLFITQEKEISESEHTRSGQISVDEIIEGIDYHNVQVFLCGPRGFCQAMRQALNGRHIDNNAIHEDIFYSPGITDATRKTPAAVEPVSVQLDYGNDTRVELTWTPDSGTLLELAESNGINLPANCRSGACRACLQPIEGDIENILEPVTPAPKNWAYLCCASPLGAMKIKL